MMHAKSLPCDGQAFLYGKQESAMGSIAAKAKKKCDT